MLASDETLETVFKRLVLSELSTLEAVSAPIFVASFFDQIGRGREISLVHYSIIGDPGNRVTSYSSAALPANVISTDLPRIVSAVSAFEKSEWN